MDSEDLPGLEAENLKPVAGEILDLFGRVAAGARSALQSPASPTASALANVNSLTSTQAINLLGSISHANREAAQVLANEPAIARVLVEDDSGAPATYYICRATPGSGFQNLASYRAPVGRLAAIPIGGELALPGGKTVTVTGKARLRPTELPEGWESRNTVFEAELSTPVTVESLRGLLSVVEDGETLDRLLAEESSKSNIRQGIRRALLTKMALRDQPVLDQFQDEIFRLPLDRRLLILGAPGTGKTTTLIRRLGQKLDVEYLDEAERRLVDSIGSVSHANSWLMFTPTDLLKQYLKEAFAREGIPAPDLCIRTWDEHRRELARNVFGVLRTTSRAGLVLKESAQILSTDALSRPLDWFADFDAWQANSYLAELKVAATDLASDQNATAAELGRRVSAILDRASGGAPASTLVDLAAEATHAASLAAELKVGTDQAVKGALNLQLNRNKDFIDDLVRFIDALAAEGEGNEGDQDDLDIDDEEEELPKTKRAVAVSAYMQAVRGQARAAAARRSLDPKSRNARIIQWLADRTLDESRRVDVGMKLLVQQKARRFVNPIKRYLDGVSRRYRAFRRTRRAEGRWYATEEFAGTDVHPLELDAILLVILRSAGELIRERNAVDAGAVWSALDPVRDLYRNQIVVDEAADFSPLQLACMEALSHPRLRSFFACGDFHQRVTQWGSKSLNELSAALPSLEVREIAVSYRQTRQLNDLAKAIVRSTSGSERGVVLPENVDSEGVAPALFEERNFPGVGRITWIAERVRDIERLVGQMPSTAIFVNSEADVVPLAEQLNAVLFQDNIRVVPCPQGQAMGHDNDVRVFDVQHIKGLEFESVFFVGVDELSTLQPELFDKYLYVGATRAATYLALTCKDSLPASIDSLRPMFVSDWAAP